MAGTFNERIRILQEEVGEGDLELKLNVHQPYAAAEHNRTYYKHPQGGMSGYVEIPFQAEYPHMLQRLADSVITDRGSNLRPEAIEAVGMFEDMIDWWAPVLTGVLRDSCNLTVTDNGHVLYHKEQEATYRYDKD